MMMLDYRAKAAAMELSDRELDRWVRDSEGMSIAHLRELTVAVYCLGREYEETMRRLKAMHKLPKSSGESQIGMVSNKKG
jgi:hypothetical protein